MKVKIILFALLTLIALAVYNPLRLFIFKSLSDPVKEASFRDFARDLHSHINQKDGVIDVIFKNKKYHGYFDEFTILEPTQENIASDHYPIALNTPPEKFPKTGCLVLYSSGLLLWERPGKISNWWDQRIGPEERKLRILQYAEERGAGQRISPQNTDFSDEL